jgi:hypothetical protein
MFVVVIASYAISPIRATRWRDGTEFRWSNKEAAEATS